MELRKYLSPEILIGDGALSLAGRYAKKFAARKALVVTDQGVMDAGWTAVVEKSLHDNGIEYTVFKDIHSNPRDFEVMNGADVFTDEECDVIVAVGGGSPIDCAKGIAIVIANGGHINQYEGVDNIPMPVPPLICLPTTSGSAADISQFAIINNSSENRKIAIISKSLVPDISLIEPRATTTKNNYLTACTAIDTLVHGIEAYVSNAASLFTDLNALKAIELVYHNLLPCLESPKEMKYRDALSYATAMAGQAFSNASLGLVHGMAHSLGGKFDAFHGEANALLLELVIDFNFNFAKEKYIRIAETLGLNIANSEPEKIKKNLIKTLYRFRTAAGLGHNTAKWKSSKEEKLLLAKNVLLDPCLATNPRPVNIDDVVMLYEKAAE
jgi:alcohol dehydrogenase class IV